MHHPALLKLQQLIQEGTLGEILSVQCTRINLGKIRNEENCWWSLAPHDLSILSLLLGESFEPVAASKMTLLGRDIEDTIQATFQTPSGKWGQIHVSWLQPFKRHETLVIGTKKIAVFEDTQPVEKKLALLDIDLQQDGETVHSINKGELTYIPYEMPDELLALEAKAFIEAFRSGIPLQNDGENGLHVVRMLDQVQTMLNQQVTDQPLVGSRP
jgi:predicted dehydrogenase